MRHTLVAVVAWGWEVLQARSPSIFWARAHTAVQCRESAGIRSWLQTLPITRVRIVFSAVLLVGRAGRRVGSSPRCQAPPAGRAGVLCCDQPAAEPAGPRPGPTCTGLPMCRTE